MRRPLSLALLSGFTTACGILPGTEETAFVVAQERHFDFLEQNGHILYPGIAIFTMTLIAFGIFQAWRTSSFDGKFKAKLKKEIVLELRRTMGGMSGEQVARAIEQDKFKTVKLLEEMVVEKLLISHTNTERRTVYRLRGVGPQ